MLHSMLHLKQVSMFGFALALCPNFLPQSLPNFWPISFAERLSFAPLLGSDTNSSCWMRNLAMRTASKGMPTDTSSSRRTVRWWGPEVRVALGTVVHFGILWYTVVLGFSKTCLHFASLLWRYRYFMILPLGAITFTVEFEWGPELAWNPWAVNSGKHIPWHSGCFSVLSFYLPSSLICYNDIIGTWTCTQDST